MAFIKRTQIQSENRSWLRGPAGTGPGEMPTVTLDATLFTGLFPNGYVPSGTNLGLVTATGKYGPYEPGATDGRQTARGLLWNSAPIHTSDTVLANALFRRGDVNQARLPFQSGKGSVDAAAKTVLNQIIFD